MRGDRHLGFHKSLGYELSLIRLGPIEPMMVAHLTPAAEKVVPLYNDPHRMGRFFEEVFELSSQQVAKFVALLGELANENHEKWIPITFGDWLPTIAADMREAVLRMSKIMHPLPLHA